jgi:hypothetical protein
MLKLLSIIKGIVEGKVFVARADLAQDRSVNCGGN